MPTNRPFLSNFLAAFRAHNAIQATAPQKSVSSQQQNVHTASNPRTITTSTSAKPGATSAALSSLHSPRTHASSPLSRSPGEDNGVGGGMGGGMRTEGRDIVGGQRYIREGRRRGSDSSSEGFRDVLGKEKWYVGGRTAHGEERYFKLGVVKKVKSRGSLSLDRLSL